MIDGDGFITLTGRKKNLIILSNGENVSPEELEMNLTRDSAVKEALVYEEDGRIVAEVYPDEKRKGDAAYFEKLRNRVNKDRPPYKRIAQITLADHEFVKNTSMKILRHKNVPAAGKKTRAADVEKTETAAR